MLSVTERAAFDLPAEEGAESWSVALSVAKMCQESGNSPPL